MTAPLSQSSPTPPLVIAVHPPPRAEQVPTDGDIWVQFREPLDPTSVDARTVYLKLDTQRTPIEITLTDSARRIAIRPLVELKLLRTYTIELTPALRSAAGASLEDLYFWQFKTLSLRPLERPLPEHGALEEGPLVPLTWRVTDADAGPVEYRIFSGLDSASVAAELVEPQITGGGVVLPTNLAWPYATMIHWKVTARHLETGETRSSPMWSFRTLSVDTPLDSMIVPIRDSGTFDPRFRSWACPDITVAPLLGPVIRFGFDAVDPALRVHDIVLELSAATDLPSLPSLWELREPIRPCDYSQLLGAPAGAYLSGAQSSGLTIRFGSQLLAAQVQARIRGRTEFLDYTLRSDRTIRLSPFQSRGLIVRHYRRAL